MGESYEHWSQYISRKLVRAARIVNVVKDGDRVIKVVVQGRQDQPLGIEEFTPTKTAMLDEAEVGGGAIVYPDEFRSITTKKSFEEDYARYTSDAPERGPLLASKANPDGWKLADLMDQLRDELMAKNTELRTVNHPVARARIQTNNQAMAFLEKAAANERKTIDLLDMMG